MHAELCIYFSGRLIPKRRAVHRDTKLGGHERICHLSKWRRWIGGRASEQVAIGHITTGAENDLQRVTAIARQMVIRWGMSERLGTISFSEREDPFAGTALATGSREYSEQTAIIIDEEVSRIVKWAYERAVSLLTSHRETLDGIAHSLRLHETLDAKQLRAIVEDTHAVHTGPL